MQGHLTTLPLNAWIAHNESKKMEGMDKKDIGINDMLELVVGRQ
jgi:hypothetical protein